ncbi:nitrate reductase molybdenum cofactor assembly chaperone [Orbus sturtevantii]|uniref:nitrate reductase molybdenum cofactor assembly chaperone n=1 Tax=Orbus sturtevantii TaxID=3074109 RepID=UPI00370DCD46
MKCCKLLSCLLDYPSDELWQAGDELIDIVNSLDELTASQKAQLVGFMADYFAMPLLDAQANYYHTFEVGNMTSLLLFEHVHGESRDRGQAMVDLIDKYSEQGLELSANQLPDYLPLFLEYLSVLPKSACQKWLENIALIIRLLGLRLEKRGSNYQILFDILYQLSQDKNDDCELVQRVANEEFDDSVGALDKSWEETQVLFQGSISNGTKHVNNSTYYITVGEAQRG